jgi:hypothetical protein
MHLGGGQSYQAAVEALVDSGSEATRRPSLGGVAMSAASQHVVARRSVWVILVAEKDSAREPSQTAKRRNVFLLGDGDDHWWE